MAVIGSTLAVPAISDAFSIQGLLVLLAFGLIIAFAWMVIDYMRILRLHWRMVRRMV